MIVYGCAVTDARRVRALRRAGDPPALIEADSDSELLALASAGRSFATTT